jgi:hypothetical protein
VLELFDVDAVDDNVLNRAVAHSGVDTFDGVHDLLGFLIRYLAEDAVLALDPPGDR